MPTVNYATERFDCIKCGGMTWIDGADLIQGANRYEMVIPCDRCDAGKARRKIIEDAGIHIHDAAEVEYYGNARYTAPNSPKEPDGGVQ